MATIYDFSRMCLSYVNECDGCPLSQRERGCRNYMEYCPDEATKLIDKWIKEHPPVTYASNFFEKFPNADKDKDLCPTGICLAQIYGGECPYEDDSTGMPVDDSCIKCWNRPYKE